MHLFLHLAAQSTFQFQNKFEAVARFILHERKIVNNGKENLSHKIVMRQRCVFMFNFKNGLPGKF